MSGAIGLEPTGAIASDARQKRIQAMDQQKLREMIGEELDLCPDIANILDDFPNVSAIVQGTIAGDFREWPLVRRELRKMLNKISDRISDIHYDYMYNLGG